MSYSAAIDLSGKNAGFAVYDRASNVLALNIARPMRGRTSATLSSWMLDALRKHQIVIDAIDRWTVGSGPGSFTGMRLVAGLVEGLSYGKPAVHARCVPTAVALAAALSAENGDSIAVLFDGRNQEILVFGINVTNNEAVPSGITEVLNCEQAEQYFAANIFSRYTAFADDRQALEKIVPGNIDVSYAEILPTENLIYAEYQDYDDDLTALSYIRPAVYAKT